MTNVGGQIGYIYGAYLWPNSDSPRYVIGFSASAAFALASLACAWYMRIVLQRENRKLKASATPEAVTFYAY
jgi:hydrogenase/urease accessory protein HupE